MRSDECAGAFAVEIKIADVKFIPRFFQLFGVRRINRAGQAVLRVVGDFQRVVEISRFNHRQHGSENFFLLDG